MTTTISPHNIRINNRLPSTDLAGAIIVTDLRPTVTWTYGLVDRVNPASDGSGAIYDTTHASPAGYEIRLGTSNSDTGTDAFNGNVAATGFVASQNTSYRFNSHLTRGVTYYGQIRITDSLGNVSLWTGFTIRYNSIPIASAVSISPTAPAAGDIILLSYVYTDQDGDIESGSKIWWFKNGIHQRHLDGLISIPTEYIRYGDTWYATVYPSDGYETGQGYSSPAVRVATPTPLLDTLELLPRNPTVNDPLTARYTFIGQGENESSIRWFVNGSPASGFTKNFARLPLSPGDSVHYEVVANDGISTGSTYASANVTILEAPFAVSGLKLNAERNPLSVLSSSPSFSWDIQPPDRTPTTSTVKIGTAPGSSNILVATLTTVLDTYTIPQGTLQPGVDYYFTVTAGDDDSQSEPEILHFRTQGSRWKEGVNNTTGWTIETTFRVNSGYQGFRVYDGSRHAEVRFYQDQVQVISGKVTTVAGDFSKFSTITITGGLFALRVYQNYKIIVGSGTQDSVTGLLQVTTTDKMIEFGSINTTDASSADYLNLYYTVSGAYAPGDAAYSRMAYETYYQIDGTIDYITSANGEMYFAASSGEANSSSDIYQVSDYIPPVDAPTVNKSFSPINAITVGGKYTYFSHSRGATVFSNYVIPSYDSDLNFKAGQRPESNGWEVVNELGAVSFTASGMEINSLLGGVAYYSQKLPGTPWYDRADNAKGWTVNFTLAVSALNNDRSAQNTDQPDGFGVYVNDGAFRETVFFYRNEIYFAGSRVSAPFNTTTPTTYTLAGRGNGVSLYAKGGDGRYALVTSSTLVSRASGEGNASRPAVAEDASGERHAAWRDDGDIDKIYYARTTNGVWGEPLPIASMPYGAARPDITVDADGTVYVVYQDESNDYTDIGIVVKNKYGWSEPYTLTSDVGDSLSPRVAVDADKNAHVVWQDARGGTEQVYYLKRTFATGNWSEPLQISTSDRSKDPAVFADSSGIFVAYTGVTDITGASAIYSTVLRSGSWTAPAIVSTSISNCGNPDVAVQNGTVWFVWDNGANIYSSKYSTSLSQLAQYVITTGLSSFPSLGIRSGSDGNTGNVYAVWEYNGSQIHGAYFDHNVGYWLSASQTHTVGMTTYGGHDVALGFNDLRVCRRPRLPKVFAGDANVVYEAEMATSGDEYLSTTDDFTVARDMVWDLTYATTVTPFGSNDIRLSGQMPRKEIRFGDFSQNISGDFVFGNFRFYAGNAVAPFDIALVSTDTQPILDNHSFCARPNANGDAWIGTQKGLAFYFRGANELANSTAPDGLIRSVAFDRTGVMFVGTDDGLLYASYDHSNFVQLAITGVSLVGAITSLDVAPDNTLWMGTSQSGVYQLLTESAVAPMSSGGAALAVASMGYDLSSGLPSLFVLRCKVDAGGTVWVCTDKGLASVSDVVRVYNRSNSGLPADRVNDIAFVDQTTRYVATSGGLAVMVGSQVDLVGIDDPNWNGNVKSLAFLAPNVLWAGTMSYMFQIMLGDNAWVSFGPSEYTNSSLAADDLRTYYVVGLNAADFGEALVEVYINDRIALHGYVISKNSDTWAIQFESPLRRSDVVRVRVRPDITQFATLGQNMAELAAYGPHFRKVGKFVTDGTKLYTVAYDQSTSDGTSLLRLNYADAFFRPYAHIGLDTTPPFGTLDYQSQIDRHTVELSIDNYGDNLSGLVEMKVSNYDNFTSDGVTPLPWSPFKPLFQHDLGTDLGLSAVQLRFAQGTGAGIVNFTDANGTATLLAGSSSPATVYTYDPSKLTWTVVQQLDLDTNNNPNPNTSIEFMVSYNALCVVGTGTPGGVGKVYVSTDGKTFNLLASVDGTSAYCGAQFNNVLYIGTGPNGKVYAYDGKGIKEVYRGMGGNIYSAAGYGNYLYFATGEQGRLYQWNPVTNTAIIIDVDPDTQLTATIGCFVTPPAAPSAPATGGGTSTLPTSLPSKVMATMPQATVTTTSTDAVGGVTITTTDNPTAVGDNCIFMGTGNTSRIMKSDNLSPFFTSFVTLAGSKVSFLKIMQGDVLYAAVGRSLLYYGDRVWLTKQGVSDTIQDAFIDDDGNIWIVTNSFIYMTKSDITKKTIYLKMRDRAGNETTVNNANLQLSLKISDLKDFTNKDRILELDEYGQTISTYDGESPFYSGNRIEEEVGVYISDVFNGTNEQVAWGTIYWDAVVPDGTTLQIGVRSANTRVALVEQSWTYYDQSQSDGVDISNYSGQYIQFTAVMKSRTRGLSPALYKVVITSVIKASVHFFTTNFILPSPVVSGIITSQKVVPVSADIVFGIDTNNSVDFSDYQVVAENRIFTAGFGQVGKNLRVGVQLISPTLTPVKTDFYPEYDGYGSPLFINVVDFDYSANTAGAKNFKITFYADFAHTQLVTTLSTSASVVGWSVNGAPFPDGGYRMASGSTASLICSIEGTSALRCNEYYYVKVEEVEPGGSASTVIAADTFIAGCNTSFVDSIDFDFTNTEGATKTFGFRAKVYSDAARTQWVKTYFSGADAVGWTVDSAQMPDVGTLVASGQAVSVGLLPDVSDLAIGKTYYLSVDSYDGTSFNKVSKSWTFKTRPISTGSCGEYTNIPVLKNFVIMFELQDGSYVMLNT